MSLAIPYENVADAQMRLQGTVVLYENHPVFIREVAAVGQGDPKEDIFRVYIQQLPLDRQRDAERKFISSKKFDMAPFPMGFLNYQGNVYYASRVPRRQQRQGLSEGTFSCNPTGVSLPPLPFGTATGLPEFVDMVEGRYPSFNDAVRQIEHGEAGGVAFSRSFAIVADSEMPDLAYLYFKKDRVGFLMEERLKLSKQGKCLSEQLREAGVQC
jgi:hypothetical protein